MTVKIGIHGAGGRMGRRLMCLAAKDPELAVTEAVDWEKHPAMGSLVRSFEPDAPGGVYLKTAFSGASDLIIDFSMPDGTAKIVAYALEKKVPVVIGTTGIGDEQAATIRNAAKSIPVVWASNYSLGVNLLLRVASDVAKALGPEFNVEIVEAHHNKKADAPSGTALSLAKSVCAALGRDIKKDLVHGRSGAPGPRTVGEIGMHALRMGSIVGDHTVHFGSEFERIELTHRAQTRDVFAAGALRAAKWVAGRAPGLYDMQDVLFG